MKRLIKFIFDNSLLLMIGAVAAMIWANANEAGYRWFVGLPLARDFVLGGWHNGHRLLDLRFLVNDVLMALFFAVAGREVWVSMLPGGDLHKIRRSSLSMLCAVGGMAGPAILYFLGVMLFGRAGELVRGWAIPTATDIAFSYMVARMIFGPAHPAVKFLLLLAIADDALGMIVLGVFYPQAPVNAAWLLLPVAAVGLGVLFWMLRIRSFAWYLLGPGAISWLGFALSGLHPALGLLPIVPVIPHMHLKMIYQGWDFVDSSDMHSFEHLLRRPVEVILGLFAFFNAGVVFSGVDAGQVEIALVVLGALVIGKPLGIMSAAWAGIKFLGLQTGLSRGEMFTSSCVAGIGFTVAIFVATAAFEPGPVCDAAKLGAAASCAAAVAALVAARICGIRKKKEISEDRTINHV